MTVRYGSAVNEVASLSSERLPGCSVEHVQVDLRFPDLPPAFDGLRIGMLSDLHIARRTRTVDALVDWTAAQSVDLWAVTGDVLEGLEGVPQVARIVEVMRAPLGCFAVAGNNDHRCYTLPEGPPALFREVGLPLLDNTHTVLSRGGARVALIGVDDPYRAKDDLPRAVEGVDDGLFRVLLAHSPGVVFHAAAAGVRLLLAGHTHGGQIRLPWVGALMARSGVRGCGRRMAAGAFSVDQVVAYVSRGIGTSWIALRVFCPPEVTTLRLHREERRDA